VVAALGAFDGTWDSLTPVEQADVLQHLCERIEFDGASGQVTMAFHPSGIQTLEDGLTQHGESAA
jgi:site-specific DNA recombinase